MLAALADSAILPTPLSSRNSFSRTLELPPWFVVYQQMQRWVAAGCFELLVEDVRSLTREWAGQEGPADGGVIDSDTLQSTPESGARAGYDGAKRRKGSKLHIAVDTLGHLPAVKVTAADQGDLAQGAD